MITEAEIYGVTVTIRPTGALTFRRMPSAILHISTYPFMPPSTMSGWLRRLFLMATGIYPETAIKKPDYYVMPPDFHVLGAYPAPNPVSSYQIHTTHRHGVRAFNHNAFSRLSGTRTQKEVYQLHTWEYLFVEQLVGVVMHTDPGVLSYIQQLQNMGAKCGKEGYAFLESVSPVRRFTRVTASAMPIVPATGQELRGASADLFLTYRHEHAQQKSVLFDPFTPQASQVAGYTSIWLGWPAAALSLEYWSDGDCFIPAGMVEVF
jgi:hypothetical protein